jgi:hypothetical protein
MTVGLALFHDGDALGEGTPFEHTNVHIFNAPGVHLAFAWLINVDGVGADKCGAVVVHLIDVRRAFDLENGAHWKNRPISRSTANHAKLQRSADGGTGTIDDVIRFAVGVGRRTDGGDAGTLGGYGTRAAGRTGAGTQQDTKGTNKEDGNFWSHSLRDIEFQQLLGVVFIVGHLSQNCNHGFSR